MKKIALRFFLVLLFVFCKPLYAIEEHTKLWTSASILQSFSENSRLKYYLEPQLRFIDDTYVFNQALMLAGLGYQITPYSVLLGGAGWVLTKARNGDTFHEYRLWQQLNWNIVSSSTYNLANRIRFEQRELADNPGIALRFRERLSVRIPFKHWAGHSLAMFDEVFFNLNHPSWVIPHFFEQNRAFIGIGTQLSKSTIMDIGYLNQYITSTPRQMGNVLVISFTVVG